MGWLNSIEIQQQQYLLQIILLEQVGDYSSSIFNNNSFWVIIDSVYFRNMHFMNNHHNLITSTHPPCAYSPIVSTSRICCPLLLNVTSHYDGSHNHRHGISLTCGRSPRQKFYTLRMQSSVKQKSERLNHSVDQNINYNNTGLWVAFLQAPTKWKKSTFVCLTRKSALKTTHTELLEQYT